jgi:hypothetical protein
MRRTTAIWTAALCLLARATAGEDALPSQPARIPVIVHWHKAGGDEKPSESDGEKATATPEDKQSATPQTKAAEEKPAEPAARPVPLYIYGESFYLRGFAPVPGPIAVDPFNIGVIGFPSGAPYPGAGAEPHWLALRFGGWGTVTHGSPDGVGEYQSLASSPFWDVDGLWTDSTRTLNFTATGLDNEDTQAGFQFYSPGLKASAGFQQFPHRLGQEPLTNFEHANGFQTQNLNVGEDYAIRVQEFKGDVGAYLTDNIKFRVQAWGMHKFGDRQANAMTHCFQAQGTSGRNCHVLSQSQHIDWLTMEVTPRLEGRFGPVTIEYSRVMRQFTQDDQPVFRSYNGLPPILVGDFPYAIVPENTTQIDQLRVGVDLTDRTRFYGYGWGGQTENHFRDVRRDYVGYDLRLTDSTLQGFSVTLYTTGKHENGTVPTTYLPDETQGLTPQQTQALIRAPVEYHRTTAGLRGRWRPLPEDPLFGRLSLTGGYEYELLDRDYAVYKQSSDAFIFGQQNTATHTVYAGVQQLWTPELDTYARYKVLFIRNPLYGFSEASGVVNTSLPEQKHIVECGAGWYPTGNFGFSANQEFDLGWQSGHNFPVPGNVVDFGEQSYATTLTAWYAPTPKLSLTAGASFLSNWIDQNITLGDDFLGFGNPGGDLTAPVTRRWNYGGRAAVLSFKADQRLCPSVWAHASYEYVRGNDRFDNRGFADLWPDLPVYSSVVVVTQRVGAGIDWKPREMMSVYLRYIYFNYSDDSPAHKSGTAHFILGGLEMIF